MSHPDTEVNDVVALLRLLRYVRDEANRLGLGETAELTNLQTATCLEEAGLSPRIGAGTDIAEPAPRPKFH